MRQKIGHLNFHAFNVTSSNPVYSGSYDMTGMRWLAITLLADRISFLGISVSFYTMQNAFPINLT